MVKQARKFAMTILSVVIVDEDASVRSRLRSQLAAEADIHIAGEAVTAHEALALARKLAPHVMLIDVNLPDSDGIELTRTLHEQHPEVAVLVMTPIGDDSVSAAIQAGATGYVRREASDEEIVRAIRAARGGEAT
jgi:two-component system response regulator DevR